MVGSRCASRKWPELTFDGIRFSWAIGLYEASFAVQNGIHFVSNRPTGGITQRAQVADTWRTPLKFVPNHNCTRWPTGAAWPMKKRVSPGARRAINLMHARSVSWLETAFGRGDLCKLASSVRALGRGTPPQLRNLLVHSSAGGDAGRPTRVRFGLWRWLLALKKGSFDDESENPEAIDELMG